MLKLTSRAFFLLLVATSTGHSTDAYTPTNPHDNSYVERPIDPNIVPPPNHLFVAPLPDGNAIGSGSYTTQGGVTFQGYGSTAGGGSGGGSVTFPMPGG
ncbi:hypothetical protein EN833_15110 [Mesorhizobium sp. M4B.F.Ca.ET.190.01.1.1]|uniref:hypothetical protein n=1 Tax=unclassified Mesorhizobium TaxID=325217 RepID=UPI001091C347|nr:MULTISPECIES: hypothetical protein [unclassified Mesorhizobium]TGR08790.1 hypothetical protein EN843_15105 [Mesorhizobium sp. M4B.F.Ca.ET.200.01.1.1]TGS18267.1 hypothetical protein EN833_15110 [Mesorhizobium sp. M4B.F.Ca.ET.190.01.1.1]TGT30080.1 hypothetical protein EN815_15090 [Mesorhizobium sp. M4B.F.Ca.ET.172.01.1.1]